jgi:hypothetical protein
MKKKICVFFTFLICHTSLIAQNPERIRVKGSELEYFYEKQEYTYPIFTKAKVFFNEGDSAGGKLNFNYLEQMMQFVNEKGDTAVIANEDEVNFISIALDTFFYNKGFYQWIASGPTTRLAMKRTYKIVERQRLGAYNTGSPTDRVESFDAVRSFSIHQLSVNEEYVFSKTQTYYLTNKIDKNFVEVNKKNILSLFPEKNKILENYFDKNKVNFKKEEDVVDLFVFLCTHR